MKNAKKLQKEDLKNIKGGGKAPDLSKCFCICGTLHGPAYCDAYVICN
ncbi:hypothetical protein [Chryseobacterium sp. OSA05B]|nr:hypothetical protein [Chryseobacterium sp. OSA05B]